MKPIFTTVHDAITDKSMVVRVDLIQTISESELDGKSVRVIQFINGDVQYVYNRLEELVYEVRSLTRCITKE